MNDENWSQVHTEMRVEIPKQTIMWIETLGLVGM
jgi:hypothetical protein